MCAAISRKDIIAMNRTSSGIRGVLDNLRTQISILDDEIRADEKSKAEYERHLTMLQNRKDDILKKMTSNQELVGRFEGDIGPFMRKYNDMTSEIGSLYDEAKHGHTNGIAILKKEFGYHPAFKRPEDTFSAVPFRPT